MKQLLTERKIRFMVLEAIIKGRALERYSTLLSRSIVNSLKDEDIQETFNTSGAATYMLDVPEVTDDIDYLSHVFVKLRQSDRVSVDAAYGYILDATEEERKDSDITVNVGLPKNYQEDLSFMTAFVPELKDTLRHELEHSSQSTEELMTLQRKVPDSNIWKNIQTAEDYYLSDVETAAHVTGIYKKAKTYKLPVTTVMDHNLEQIYYTGLSYETDPEQLESLMNRISKKWANYLFDRYPRAK